MADIRKGYQTPAEVTSYFDRKTLKPAFSWQDVWGEEHAYAFTVAKATELELLNTFRNSISKAIAGGKGFENWKGEIRDELRKIGWAGPRMVTDPIGQDPDRMVNFASVRRLKTIFWSNMNSARSAGQWERAQRTKKVLPYILYVQTTSADPRPEHLAFVGIILPVDDPFWDTHWTPNGWLCKCQVRQISVSEASSLLAREPAEGRITYRKTPPDLGPDIEHRNRRTGEVTTVPPGIDPGWQTNPGKARASTLIKNLEMQLESASDGDAKDALQAMWQDPFLKLAPKLDQKVWLPAGHSLALAETLQAKSALVSVTSEIIAQRVERHKMGIDDFSIFPELVEKGLVFPDPNGNGRTRMLILKTGKTYWRTFVSVSVNGYLRANSLHQKGAKELRSLFERQGLLWPFDEK